MKNKKQSNIHINPNKNINNKKTTHSDDFDNFLKSLLNHKKSKQNRNKQSTHFNHQFFQTIENYNNNPIKIKKSQKNEKNLLFSTFSKNNFLTLDQVIEFNNKSINNNSNNKYNSIPNIKHFDKNEIFNKTSEKMKYSNSNYNLILVNKINNIKKENRNIRSISNINKIDSKKNSKLKKQKKNNNLNDKKLFDTYDNNINNYGELIYSLKNTLKGIQNDGNYDNNYDIIKISKQNKKNNLSRNKSMELNNILNINKSDFKTKIKIRHSPDEKSNDIKKLNKDKQYNINNKEEKGQYHKIPNTDISVYKYKNYSCPIGLNFINVKRSKEKINKNKINKSNITMNNNYIFNNFQNKYNLESYFQKPDKYKNIYSITYNTEIDLPKISPNNKIIKNAYNENYYNSKINISNNKYKIIKTSSFIIKANHKYYFNNIKLKDIEYINKKFINFFMKIIDVYKNILLKQKKKEKLLLNEIIEKNNEIKRIKNSSIKMIYYFKKEMNQTYIKDFIYKKILIEKQLIIENNYLRNLLISKYNLSPNFYSSYENSYDGFIDLIEKGFINNQIKHNNKNSNDTANNSPQITNREDLRNEGLLFINKKNRIFKNCYILKKK